MDITVKGNKTDVGEALKGHVEDNLQITVKKYFAQALKANVVFSREGHLFHVEISVHAGRGMDMMGGAENNDAYAAFDNALGRISKQLRRYKRRLNNHHKARSNYDPLPAQSYVIAPEHDQEEVPEEATPVIIAEMPEQIATLSVGEAVMRMDLADVPVVMFRNHSNGGLNVVYRRTDGNVGWIDPSALEK
jgi:ribosomal subunit interface protein